ncbi:MAG: helix-turn-helix domain-containing protein [Calditrichia bacterium]
MQASLSTIQVILILGAVQGILLATYFLLGKRGNVAANRLLGGTLLVYSIIIFSFVLEASGYVLYLPHLARTTLPLIFLLGPLNYLYAKRLILRAYRLKKTALLHLLPTLICVLLFSRFYLKTTSEKVDYILANFSQVCEFCPLIAGLVLLQSCIYLTLILHVLYGNRELLMGTAVSVDKLNIKWLVFLFTALLVTWGLALNSFIGPMPGIKGSYLWGTRIENLNQVWLLVSLLMYSIGYVGLMQPVIFHGERKGTMKNALLDVSKSKYAKSGLSDARAEKFLHKLLTVMNEEKPYLNAELKLATLANKMGLSQHDLSQVINTKLDCNFFGMVNAYRVDEAKILLHDSSKQHYTIAQIALLSGFNSVSSFNAAFRKQMQMTPSQYRSKSG